jgi:hypothetical protein
MSATALTPEFLVTFSIFLAALGVVGWMAMLEKKPKDSLSPRLLPTTPIMMVAGFAALLALIHVVNLMGVHTGR